MDSLDGRWYSTVILDWRLLEVDWLWKDLGWLIAAVDPPCGDVIVTSTVVFGFFSYFYFIFSFFFYRGRTGAEKRRIRNARQTQGAEVGPWNGIRQCDHTHRGSTKSTLRQKLARALLR